MYKKSMIATLFLLLAGIQTASAQGMRVWQNGDYFFFPFSNVDSIQLTPLNPVTNISLSLSLLYIKGRNDTGIAPQIYGIIQYEQRI